MPNEEVAAKAEPITNSCTVSSVMDGSATAYADACPIHPLPGAFVYPGNTAPRKRVCRLFPDPTIRSSRHSQKSQSGRQRSAPLAPDSIIFPRALAPAYQRFIVWKAFSEKASCLLGKMSGCAMKEVQLPGSGSLLGHGPSSKLQTPKKYLLFSLVSHS